MFFENKVIVFEDAQKIRSVKIETDEKGQAWAGDVKLDEVLDRAKWVHIFDENGNQIL